METNAAEAEADMEHGEEDFKDEVVEVVTIRDMICHILTVYPVISPTMLQNALGPSCKATRWRPVLEELTAEGLVVMTAETLITPHSRYNSYKRLMLTDKGKDYAELEAKSREQKAETERTE